MADRKYPVRYLYRKLKVNRFSVVVFDSDLENSYIHDFDEISMDTGHQDSEIE